MTTRFFGGNTLAAFQRDSTLVAEVTTAGTFDSAYVPNSISVPVANGGKLVSQAFSATSTLWFAGELYCNDASSNSGIADKLLFEVLAGSTTVFRIKNVSSNSRSLEVQYWNGSSFVTIGSSVAWPAWTTRLRFAVKVIGGASGSYVLYINGSSYASGSIASASCDNFTRVQYWNPSNNSQAMYFSQLLAADYDLRDSCYMLAALNGNSASNTGAASGAYTDVNETVLDESTAITITASGNKAGQTHSAITVPAGYIIAAAVINARGRVTGTITDGKLGVRSGGSNTSSTGRSYNAGYEPRSSIVQNDPNTSTNFTQTGFNNAEMYLEAA